MDWFNAAPGAVTTDFAPALQIDLVDAQGVPIGEHLKAGDSVYIKATDADGTAIGDGGLAAFGYGDEEKTVQTFLQRSVSSTEGMYLIGEGIYRLSVTEERDGGSGSLSMESSRIVLMNRLDSTQALIGLNSRVDSNGRIWLDYTATKLRDTTVSPITTMDIDGVALTVKNGYNESGTMEIGRAHV